MSFGRGVTTNSWYWRAERHHSWTMILPIRINYSVGYTNNAIQAYEVKDEDVADEAWAALAKYRLSQ